MLYCCSVADLYTIARVPTATVPKRGSKRAQTVSAGGDAGQRVVFRGFFMLYCSKTNCLSFFAFFPPSLPCSTWRFASASSRKTDRLWSPPRSSRLLLYLQPHGIGRFTTADYFSDSSHWFLSVS